MSLWRVPGGQFGAFKICRALAQVQKKTDLFSQEIIVFCSPGRKILQAGLKEKVGRLILSDSPGTESQGSNIMKREFNRTYPSTLGDYTVHFVSGDSEPRRNRLEPRPSIMASVIEPDPMIEQTTREAHTEWQQGASDDRTDRKIRAIIRLCDERSPVRIKRL